jgi:acylphosphatase
MDERVCAVGEMVRARIRVSGIVQGVGYRYFVRNTATSLGLGGLVRNMPDGTVEVVVEGDRELVTALVRELRIGPRYATVKGLDVQWEQPRKDFSGFDYAF